jgi:hypothetical protein
MDNDAQLTAIKILIEQGKILRFESIFMYIKKKPLAIKAGVTYSRFLYLVRHPAAMTFSESAQIARALDIQQGEFKRLISA